VVVAASNHGIYDVLVGAHVVAAIVGFGSVAVSGVYGASARRLRPGTPDRAERPEQVEEIRRYFRGHNLVEYLVLVVPFLGVAALALRPGRHGYGDVWVVAGAVIWAAASVLLLFVVRPAEGAIRRAAGSGDRAGAGRYGTRLFWASVAMDVLFVTALAFMVTQPQ
jgi:hypothetical protein